MEEIILTLTERINWDELDFQGNIDADDIEERLKAICRSQGVCSD